MSRLYLNISLLTAIMMLSISMQAQDINSLVRSGDMAAENGNYYGAAHFYKQALRIDGTIPELNHKMAEVCRKDNNYRLSAKYYKKLVPHYQEKYPMAEYYLAKMLKATGDYLLAQYYFRNYYDRNKEENADKLSVKKAKREIIACEKAQRMMFRPKDIAISQMDEDINTVYAELSADGYADSLLYFTSVQPVDSAGKIFEAGIYQNNADGTNYLDSSINQKNMHAANPFYDSVHSRLYFTLSGAGQVPRIYAAEKKGNSWSEARKLPESVNVPGYSSTHPVTVHTDSLSYLIYASNRPGGAGGFDLYYHIIKDKLQFSRPYNIGRRIPGDSKYSYLVDTTTIFNTPGNEITPFYDQSDSSLYFSSDWYYGMGEYDIFSMKWDFNIPDTGSISNPGYPVNSPRNDLYYRVDKTHSKAYISSNREGALAYTHQACCNDIFAYDLPKKHVKKSPEEIRKEAIAGMKQMAEELIPITLYFHNDRPDPGSRDSTTDVSYDESIRAYLDRQTEYRKKFAEGLSREASTEAMDSIDNFFENDVNAEYQRLRKFLLLLEELLEEDQKIVLTIKGYTSPLHTPEYNLRLAKRRINSFINFIHDYKSGMLRDDIESGLLEIHTLPYGETRVAKGISDNPDDRRNSVYNPIAAKERKIKILAVRVSGNS
ncbi:MAG: tetratricopeptide repeat protein [Bacteroidales bacterium]